MSHPLRTSLAALAMAALAVLPATPAAAQASGTIRIDGKDSVAFLVLRRAPASTEESVRTKDEKVAVVLRDSVVILQLTDEGMDKLFESDTTPRGVGEAILARMLRAGVAGLLDHGIAYRVSALRAARAEGGLLVLEDRDGKHVFEDTNVNGRHVMEQFAPGDAARFARAVQRAIDARR